MNDAPIVVCGLTKQFRIYPRQSGRIVEWLSLGRRTRHTLFTALDQISFDVKRGECFGVIGCNGAGKSTLMRILARTLFPSSGSVRVCGSVFPLLQAGLGLEPDLTGEENMRHLWRLWGRAEDNLSAERCDEIREFADIGSHFFQPVKHYSAGMCARIFFSIGTAFRPDVLIVDEVLAVGDARFVAKCYDRVHALIAAGCTLVYVSHDLDSIRALCANAIWLKAGRVAALGDAREVVDRYLEDVFGDGIAIPPSLVGGTPAPTVPTESLRESAIGPPSLGPDPGLDGTPGMVRQGDGDFHVLNLTVENQDGQPCSTYRVHDRLTARILFECIRERNDDLCVAFAIRSKRGEFLVAINTVEEKVRLPRLNPGDRLEVRFDLEVTLGAGEYLVDCSVEHNDRQHIAYCDVLRSAKTINVVAASDRRIVYGVVWVPNKIQVTGFLQHPAM